MPLPKRRGIALIRDHAALPPDLPESVDGAPIISPACGFRDVAFIERGVSRVFGLATQTSAYQREAVELLHPCRSRSCRIRAAPSRRRPNPPQAADPRP